MRSVNEIIAFKFQAAVNLIHWRYDAALGVDGLVYWDAEFFGVPKPNLGTIQQWNAELAVVVTENPERAAQIESELGIVIDPNEQIEEPA